MLTLFDPTERELHFELTGSGLYLIKGTMRDLIMCSLGWDEKWRRVTIGGDRLIKIDMIQKMERGEPRQLSYQDFVPLFSMLTEGQNKLLDLTLEHLSIGAIVDQDVVGVCDGQLIRANSQIPSSEKKETECQGFIIKGLNAYSGVNQKKINYLLTHSSSELISCDVLRNLQELSVYATKAIDKTAKNVKIRFEGKTHEFSYYPEQAVRNEVVCGDTTNAYTAMSDLTGTFVIGSKIFNFGGIANGGEIFCCRTEGECVDKKCQGARQYVVVHMAGDVVNCLEVKDLAFLNYRFNTELTDEDCFVWGHKKNGIDLQWIRIKDKKKARVGISEFLEPLGIKKEVDWVKNCHCSGALKVGAYSNLLPCILEIVRGQYGSPKANPLISKDEKKRVDDGLKKSNRDGREITHVHRRGKYYLLSLDYDWSVYHEFACPGDIIMDEDEQPFEEGSEEICE